MMSTVTESKTTMQYKTNCVTYQHLKWETVTLKYSQHLQSVQNLVLLWDVRRQYLCFGVPQQFRPALSEHYKNASFIQCRYHYTTSSWLSLTLHNNAAAAATTVALGSIGFCWSGLFFQRYSRLGQLPESLPRTIGRLRVQDFFTGQMLFLLAMQERHSTDTKLRHYWNNLYLIKSGMIWQRKQI